MECLAELYVPTFHPPCTLTAKCSRYTANRQHGKALTYFLRLRRPNVLDVIREHNLFTDVQDQVLLLVEFDHERMRKRQEAGEAVDEDKSDAISLLVDNIHSIHVCAVHTHTSTLLMLFCRFRGLCLNFNPSLDTCFCISMLWSVGILILYPVSRICWCVLHIRGRAYMLKLYC